MRLETSTDCQHQQVIMTDWWFATYCRARESKRPELNAIHRNSFHVNMGWSWWHQTPLSHTKINSEMRHSHVSEIIASAKTESLLHSLFLYPVSSKSQGWTESRSLDIDFDGLGSLSWVNTLRQTSDMNIPSNRMNMRLEPDNDF